MQLINAEKAAPMLGLENKIAVYEAARKGLVPHVRIGRRVRFDVESLKEWVARGGTTAADNQPASARAKAS